MVANAERRKIVQRLRHFAREKNVPQVSDTASKTAVLSMVRALLAIPDLADGDRESIRTAQAEYEAT